MENSAKGRDYIRSLAGRLLLMEFDSKSHWEGVYQSKLPEQVSWFQPHLKKSLEWIAASGIDKKAKIIDVGGGVSTSREFGKKFRLLKSGKEDHRTRFETTQDFVYCLFEKSG